LSFAEPRPRSLLRDWVDLSLAEGLASAKGRGAPLLYSTSMKTRAGLPLRVFDSSVEDAFLFAGRDRVALGLGVAKTFDPNASSRQGRRTRRSLREVGAFSTPDSSKITIMGGWGFPPTVKGRRAGIWREFPSSRWVIPAVVLTVDGENTLVTLVAEIRPTSDLAKLRRLYRPLVKTVEADADVGRKGPEPDAGGIPRLESVRSVPSRETWLSLAAEAIDSIARDELKKVVLARAVDLTFQGKVPASSVIKRLVALNPDSTVFAVKAKGSVFLGATPESLVSVKNGDVEVDCLAASSRRSENTAADETLGTMMLGDSKSRREHEFVVRAAVRALSPISSSVEVPREPVLKKLTKIQHLYTPVRAKLLDGNDAWDAARALWPNPAIGGEPKDQAVSWIRRSERLDRGWYSGVVGLLDPRLDEADLVVAIRSGVIKGRRAVIYAGAGLVAGSEPQEEFEETSLKLGTMGRALGIDERVLADGGA
jgi:menaquinone-specific isochorismate synthase